MGREEPGAKSVRMVHLVSGMVHFETESGMGRVRKR